jgi:hypothetical protein
MKQRSNEVKTEAVAIVPNWELLVHTPAVFVRVANKGVAGYGTWKSIRNSGGTGRPTTGARKRIKDSARLHGDNSTVRIARLT